MYIFHEVNLAKATKGMEQIVTNYLTFVNELN